MNYPHKPWKSQRGPWESRNHDHIKTALSTPFCPPLNYTEFVFLWNFTRTLVRCRVLPDLARDPGFPRAWVAPCTFPSSLRGLSSHGCLLPRGFSWVLSTCCCWARNGNCFLCSSSLCQQHLLWRAFPYQFPVLHHHTPSFHSAGLVFKVDITVCHVSLYLFIYSHLQHQSASFLKQGLAFPSSPSHNIKGYTAGHAQICVEQRNGWK